MNPRENLTLEKSFEPAAHPVKGSVDASLLIVDDDPMIISLLSRILVRYKTVRFATSGEDALRLARLAPPDVILLDAQLGGMSGLKVCEALKSDKSLRGISVLFVSGCSEPEFESAVLKIGAGDFIQKPFSPSQVVACVNNQLRLRHQAADLVSLSRVDGDTGLANRAAFDDMVDAACRARTKHDDPYRC